jgi:hypothetical protein
MRGRGPGFVSGPAPRPIRIASNALPMPSPPERMGERSRLEPLAAQAPRTSLRLREIAGGELRTADGRLHALPNRGRHTPPAPSPERPGNPQGGMETDSRRRPGLMRPARRRAEESLKRVDNCWQFYYIYFGHETLELGSSAGDQLYYRLAVVSGRKASCPCPPIAYWDNPGRSASPGRHHGALCPSVLRRPERGSGTASSTPSGLCPRTRLDRG